MLIEGPPEGDGIVPLAPELDPPVALLVYQRDEPSSSVHYPFARFSPEWVAMLFGLRTGVPVRFVDLPAAVGLATPDRDRPGFDPIARLAETAGYEDPERWWEDWVERQAAPFDSIREAMGALREGYEPPPTEARREAHMRQGIRAALRSGSSRIAVVCGAWHAPALDVSAYTQTGDAKLLRGLRKAKVQATWVPWSYELLAFESGYAAGVESPAWYEHLFDAPEEPIAPWLARAATLLRGEGLDASSAQVVDAARLANALAVLRGRPAAGLPELTDALTAAVTGGSALPLGLVRERLIVGRKLGGVPDDAPMVPLQADLVRWQKRLRLKPEAGARPVQLDLRKENDRLRSRLLHRLDLLGLPWGEPEEAYGARGSFREHWVLQWTPQLAVELIAKSRYGTTVEAAATAVVRERLARGGEAGGAGAGAPRGGAASLSELTALARGALLADLGDAARAAVVALEERAAAGADVPELMDGVGPLADVVRYGDVRGSDVALVRPVLVSMLTRSCIGLPLAVASLDDEAARAMAERSDAVANAVSLLDEPALREQWHRALWTVGQRPGVHGLVAGRAWRLLLDSDEVDRERAAAELSKALSRAAGAAAGAAWLEGFLAGSGLVLVHDEALLGLIDEWLAGLPDDRFTDALPLVRRSFSVLTQPERRQVAQRLRAGPKRAADAELDVDVQRAEAALDLVTEILGAR